MGASRSLRGRQSSGRPLRRRRLRGDRGLRCPDAPSPPGARLTTSHCITESPPCGPRCHSLCSSRCVRPPVIPLQISRAFKKQTKTICFRKITCAARIQAHRSKCHQGKSYKLAQHIKQEGEAVLSCGPSSRPYPPTPGCHTRPGAPGTQCDSGLERDAISGPGKKRPCGWTRPALCLSLVDGDRGRGQTLAHRRRSAARDKSSGFHWDAAGKAQVSVGLGSRRGAGQGGTGPPRAAGAAAGPRCTRAPPMRGPGAAHLTAWHVEGRAPRTRAEGRPKAPAIAPAFSLTSGQAHCGLDLSPRGSETKRTFTHNPVSEMLSALLPSKRLQGQDLKPRCLSTSLPGYFIK